MKKLAWQSALLAGTLILLSVIFRLRLNNTYMAYLPEMSSEQDLQNEGAGAGNTKPEEEGAGAGNTKPEEDGAGAGNTKPEEEGAGAGNTKPEEEGAGAGNTKPEEEGAGAGNTKPEEEGAGAGNTKPEEEGAGAGNRKPEEEGAGAGDEDINFDVHVRNMENETDGINIKETMAQGDMPAMAVEAQEPGEYIAHVVDDSGETVARRRYYVDKYHNIFDYSTGGFTGDQIVMSAITIFLIIESIFMMRAFFRAKGADFYAYSTIHLAGFSLFLLQMGIGMLIMTIRHQLDPASYTMHYVYSILSSSGLYFIILTSPFIVAFAVSMTVSNIALIRHEGKRRRNFLGILISALMLIGLIITFVIFFGRNLENPAISGVKEQVVTVAQNIYAAAYVYFECMLIGAIICGLIAARHVPSRECSHIVILGCGFRKDGTLPPLLRGRVDKAIEFWNMQKEENKSQAVFVPSGGQGPNECMPEASAMQNYLLSQGIPAESIYPEDKSRNTYQNMEFSKALIEDKDPGAKVIFSTTNYHVFRSGVWASLAGLRAEGIGSDTKWWFWPNAFMRECVGLLANKWKQETVLLLIMIAIFTLLTILL